MLESYSRCWVEIDYDAIVHNVQEIQKLVGNTKILGIVKANAYGHGAVKCAHVLEEKCGVDFFGVASVDEAVELRDSGITSDILVLGYTPEEHFHYLAEKKITQSLVSLEYARKLNDYAKKEDVVIHAHCKVDTGMNRTGIVYQDQQKNMESIIEVYSLTKLAVDGIFSHFPVSDDLNVESTFFTRHQIELFKEVTDTLKSQGINPGLCHIQNSYGILNYGDLHMDYCRPGLLYMGVTSDDTIPYNSNPNFIPILSLYANVSVVKTIDQGQSVSYGRHFKALKPTKIATISVGYADGLPRLLSNKNHEVLIHGKRCPLVGNICMDQCMVDVSEVEDVQEGDVCCVVGRQGDEIVTIDSISRDAQTINNETLSAIAARVPRLEKRG